MDHFPFPLLDHDDAQLSVSPTRLPYCKPVLQTLGDLRTLTLGGTIQSPGDFSGDFNYTPYQPS